MKAKIGQLETGARNDESVRNELRQKLRQSEDYNQEMSNFIKGL